MALRLAPELFFKRKAPRNYLTVAAMELHILSATRDDQLWRRSALSVTWLYYHFGPFVRVALFLAISISPKGPTASRVLCRELTFI
jgi:hypothetical protein